MHYFIANYISNMQMFSVLNDDFTFLSCFIVILLLLPFSCGVYYLLCFANLQNNLNDPFQYFFLKKQFKGLPEKLYNEQYPHHLNQARGNEAESDRARLLWAETPPPAKS